MTAGNFSPVTGLATYPRACEPRASSWKMFISTPGTSVSTAVRTGAIGTFAWAASLPSQNASKSEGRGTEGPSFEGAIAAPTAYLPLFRPVLPPVNSVEAAAGASGSIATYSISGRSPTISIVSRPEESFSFPSLRTTALLRRIVHLYEYGAGVGPGVTVQPTVSPTS